MNKEFVINFSFKFSHYITLYFNTFYDILSRDEDLSEDQLIFDTFSLINKISY